MSKQRRPHPPALVAEARAHPNGWVYEVDGEFGPTEHIPPEAIVGCWRVDGNGEIVGDFVKNPNYRPRAESSAEPAK